MLRSDEQWLALADSFHAAVAGRGLALKKGRLRALQPAAAQALDNAIQTAAASHTKPGPPVPRTVIIHSQEADTPPVVLDVFASPSAQHPLGFSDFTPRVLVVGRGAAQGSDGRKAAALSAAYELAPAELVACLINL